MKKLISIGVVALLTACTPKQVEKMEEITLQPNEVIAGINLTVAEGKRLIAEGIANREDVKNLLQKGMIIITRGTTNTYIAERLAGLEAPHGSFMTGNVTPVARGKVDEGIAKKPEIILIDGKETEISYEDALANMQPGDIIFKGANLLNYERRQAAVCIGAPDGGTTARLRPHVGEGKGRFIIPIGLEKEVWGDLNQYEKILCQEAQRLSYAPKLWVHKDGEIYTEIEALKQFGKVEVIPYAAGGIAGREGGISLALYGDSTEVKKVLEIVTRIQGEKTFID